MRSAVVLAGGYSTRFGDGDKATAKLDGDPLIRHVAQRVEHAVDEVVVNCREEQRDAIAGALDGVDHRFAIDPVPDGGPVAGVRTGCRVARGRFTFITACDMPFIRPQMVTQLFEATEEDGAVPLIDDRLRPLAGVYRSEAAVDAADTTLSLGSNALTNLLDRLSVVTVPSPAPVRAVQDIDTEADLAAARSNRN